MSIHQILLSAVGKASATGGTQITSGATTYHVFTSPGTLTVQGQLTAEVLIVAGGGGGGRWYYGGGGGAGIVND